MQAPTPLDELTIRSCLHSPPVSQEDRRRHPRYRLNLAITMAGENNFYSGLSENISEAGVFVATHQALPIGTPVVLSFTLPTADEPISVIGIVRWVREPRATAGRASNFAQDGECESVKPGMGVQFTEVPPAARAEIHAFMRRRSPEFFDE